MLVLSKASPGMVEKLCPVCKRTFWKFPSDAVKRVCCSWECRKKRGRTKGKHNMSRTRLYVIWTDMKNRCYCRSSVGFAYYGARGIRVCADWRHDFLAFHRWAVASGYADTLEIDRRDVDGDYEPGNCRWATRRQQMTNTRKRRDAETSRFKGVSRQSPSGRWVAQGHRNSRPVYLGLFDAEEDAARAYDKFALAEYGEFARPNFQGKVGASR